MRHRTLVLVAAAGLLAGGCRNADTVAGPASASGPVPTPAPTVTPAPAASLDGSVTTSTQWPMLPESHTVSGAKITVSQAGSPPIGTFSSPSDGSYAIAGLRTGTATVIVTYLDWPPTTQTFNLAPGPNHARLKVEPPQRWMTPRPSPSPTS